MEYLGRGSTRDDDGKPGDDRFTETTESRNDLANRLEALHCEVDKVGRDWMKAGDFVPTEPKAAKKKPANR
jgi:hypothetical protein